MSDIKRGINKFYLGVQLTAHSEWKWEVCQADAPKVTDAELAELVRMIPDWAVQVRDGVMQLERVYKFKNFKGDLTNGLVKFV